MGDAPSPTPPDFDTKSTSLKRHVLSDMPDVHIYQENHAQNY